MKKLSLFFVLVAAIAFISCSKKDDPSPANSVNERLAAVQADDGMVTLSYDDQGRLESIVDDDGGDPFNIFYVTGDIQGAIAGDPPAGLKEQDLDDDRGFHIYSTTMVNGNPVEMKAIVEEEVYDPNTGMYDVVWNEYVIKVTYDTKLSPLFLVMDQSGMMPTIDDIVLGSPNPTYAALNAAGLFSKNNPTKVEVFDSSGDLMESEVVTYQYDAAGMPTKAINSDGDITTFIYTPK